ncbi:MAG: PEP-CTERM sorting domain-containing protein [Steroidobacteraceae bacterium]|nr:PEP-CTERM sorting domain-containing protein [Steroidobacteraceae bacterium]
MRSSIAAIAVSVFFAASANAVPVTWDLNAVVARTNLPALGDIAVGDAFSASMVVETDTPVVHIPFASSTGYFNVFDSFSLTIAGRTLTLGPDSADMGFAREANWLGTANFEDFQVLQMAALLFDGTDAYQAYLSFEFTDLAAFPIGTLPASPPSLSSARLRDFSIYSPVNGDPRNGALFVAGGDITSFTSRSVPEPSTLTLLLGGLALVWVARRQQGLARQD